MARALKLEATDTWLSAANPDDAADLRFCAAVDAIAAVFAASTDPDADWLALRSALNLQAGRDAITGEK